MNDPAELSDFGDVCRLFPLPEMVHFPFTILRLHIFEPRYRQMTEDALASGDKLITMVQLCPPGASPSRGLGSPPIEEVACLGRIVQHGRHPDGRFDLLLLGLKRVRLIRELARETLYRQARAEILEDEEIAKDDPRPIAIETLFRRFLRKNARLRAELTDVLDAGVPPGPLTDLVANALAFPPDLKQELLAETRVGRRADLVLDNLAHFLSLVEDQDDRPVPFPPPFSAN